MLDNLAQLLDACPCNSINLGTGDAQGTKATEYWQFPESQAYQGCVTAAVHLGIWASPCCRNAWPHVAMYRPLKGIDCRGSRTCGG